MKRSELDIVLKELTEQIYDLLGDKLDKVVLYGSYARGDNTEESDVDVLVLTNMEPEENRNGRGRTSDLQNRRTSEPQAADGVPLPGKGHRSV